MKLPNAEHAVVDLDKLCRYCLDPTHPRGRHKARVFRAACGVGVEHAEALRAALLDAAGDHDGVARENDAHGQRFVLDFVYEGPTGAATLRSAWMIRRGEDFPRFVSCYVLS